MPPTHPHVSLKVITCSLLYLMYSAARDARRGDESVGQVDDGDAAACKADCEKQASCVAVTISDDEEAKCYLRSAVDLEK